MIFMKNFRRTGPLFTDLYELTMAASYFRQNAFSEATFSLFIREMDARNYFVAAGLEEVLQELESFHFSEEEIAFLQQTRMFPQDFLEYLKRLRFTGNIFALPEGTIFFANEPILEVTAPIIEAQLLETYLLNTIGSQTIFATKAARCIHAAKGRPVIDFSLRRTQGKDAGLNVARSSAIAGFSSTSNVLAGKKYGIPVSGTMAHSYVSTFDHEIDAFYAYADAFPDDSVFLIDTYDTIKGAANAVKVAKDMKNQGHSLKGVRLDSGDMVSLSKRVREILDEAGLEDVKIYASSGFDEFEIDDLLSKGAKIDAFGVGTKVGVSADVPYLDIVYKMVRFNGRNVRKLSPGKVTLAGEKQLFRKRENGLWVEDILGLRQESMEGRQPLLSQVMATGKCIIESPSLKDIQNHFKSNFSALPDSYKSIYDTQRFPVRLSDRLIAVQDEI
jgi:nicotinate phosphoribosyltransferase